MLSVHNDDELKSEPERVDGDSNANTNRLGNGASNSNSKAANEKNKGNNQNNKNAKDDKSDESFQLWKELKFEKGFFLSLLPHRH